MKQIRSDMRIVQVLAAPDMEGKKRRGGKRFRKMRERYGMTDTRKAANRVNFNQAEEEFLDGDEVLLSFTLHHPISLWGIGCVAPQSVHRA